MIPTAAKTARNRPIPGNVDKLFPMVTSHSLADFGGEGDDLPDPGQVPDDQGHAPGRPGREDPGKEALGHGAVEHPGHGQDVTGYKEDQDDDREDEDQPALRPVFG